MPCNCRYAIIVDRETIMTWHLLCSFKYKLIYIVYLFGDIWSLLSRNSYSPLPFRRRLLRIIPKGNQWRSTIFDRKWQWCANKGFQCRRSPGLPRSIHAGYGTVDHLDSTCCLSEIRLAYCSSDGVFSRSCCIPVDHNNIPALHLYLCRNTNALVYPCLHGVLEIHQFLPGNRLKRHCQDLHVPEWRQSHVGSWVEW